jgi:hypothetical protein
VLVVAAGVVLGLRPLHDNSFLTHLATGRLILDRGAVPHADPYTFTAHGQPWVVQSWLVSVLYAATERLGGMDGVRLVVGAMAGALTALCWRLTRPVDGLVPRLALGAVVVAVGAGVWAERPFMVGLIAFALVALAADGGLDPRWLVPVGWIWVNAHGSFPLGIVYLLVIALGSRLDGLDWRPQLRCLWLAGVGMLLGAVGPLGPRVLIFPVELLQRQDVLRNVVEWQAPAFTELSQRVFLIQVVAAIVLLARRPSWRASLVLGVFMAAALLGSRNIAVASIALLPTMAVALAGVGSLTAAKHMRRGGVILAVVVGASSLLVAGRLEEPPLQLTAYPVDALAFIDQRGIDTGHVHMAAPDFVGNLLTLVYGPGRRVFYDDRFDMYPPAVSTAELALTKAEPTVFTELARFDIDVVTVRHDHSMALALTISPAWRVLYTDEHWLVACRRGAALSGASDRC